MDTSNIIKTVKHFLGSNNTTILTGIGVTGTITTAYLSGRASIKAYQIVEEMDNIRTPNDPELTAKDKVKAVWPLYIPPVGVGALTIGCIITANHLNSKRAAALAAAYSISERTFSEYKDKVIEKMGETKERAVRDEINQDRLNKNPIEGSQVIVTSGGQVLCFDAISGRYFNSDMETLRRAMNTINYKVINEMSASLSQFYDEIDLPPTAYSDSVGWNTENLIDLDLSTMMSTDGRPCIVLDFTVGPKEYYSKLY